MGIAWLVVAAELIASELGIGLSDYRCPFTPATAMLWSLPAWSSSELSVCSWIRECDQSNE
jgi:hypothetical protein